MISSPSQDHLNLNQCIEDTSSTKAVIFRRLYENKSKPITNKSDLTSYKVHNNIKNDQNKY